MIKRMDFANLNNKQMMAGLTPLNCHKHLFLYEDGGAMPLNCRKPIFLYEDGGAMPLNLVMNKILGRSPIIFVERNKKEIKKGA
jgi:hypothetical protein